MARVGVLLTAYGGPRGISDIGPFLTSIMGSEPSEAVLRDAQRRYLAIGGLSPLPFMVESIAVQLERALSGLPAAPSPDEEGMGLIGVPAPLPRAVEGVKIPVAVGMLHSEPSIASGVKALADAGVKTVIVLSMSPFDCESTTGKYFRAVDEAASAAGVTVVEAAKYNLAVPFLTVVADSLQAALQAEEVVGRRALVVFTAHSLPAAEVEAEPCYVEQLQQTAESVAYRLDLGPASSEAVLPGIDAYGGGESMSWLLAFQSKGKRGGEWIGPAIEDVIDAAAAEGYGAIIVSPVGFAIDHMETLYDLDVLAAERTLDADLEFSRAAAPNDAPEMIAALAEAVRKVI